MIAYIAAEDDVPQPLGLNPCGKILLSNAAILFLHILGPLFWLVVTVDKTMQIQEIVDAKR